MAAASVTRRFRTVTAALAAARRTGSGVTFEISAAAAAASCLAWPGFALQTPGQLARLILRPCLYACLGGQLFHRLAELFAGPLDLLRQLLRVIRRHSGGGADILTRNSGGDGRLPRPGFGRAAAAAAFHDDRLSVLLAPLRYPAACRSNANPPRRAPRPRRLHAARGLPLETAVPSPTTTGFPARRVQRPGEASPGQPHPLHRHRPGRAAALAAEDAVLPVVVLRRRRGHARQARNRQAREEPGRQAAGYWPQHDPGHRLGREFIPDTIAGMIRAWTDRPSDAAISTFLMISASVREPRAGTRRTGNGVRSARGLAPR